MPIRLTQCVKILLSVSLSLFIFQQTADQFFGMHVLKWFALVPSLFWTEHAYWQILTYSFVQRDVMQLFFNMMMLAFMGSELEIIWGAAQFCRYYFFCAILSGCFYLLLQLTFMKSSGLYMPLMGPSGAIYGLLTAYGILFGDRVLLFMMLFPMKAKHFVWVLGLIELMTTFYSSGGGAVSFSLLAGMLAGFCYLTGVVRWRHFKKNRTSWDSSNFRKPKRSNHLKLIVNHPPSDLAESDSDSIRDGSKPERPKTWH